MDAQCILNRRRTHPDNLPGRLARRRGLAGGMHPVLGGWILGAARVWHADVPDAGGRLSVGLLPPGQASVESADVPLSNAQKCHRRSGAALHGSELDQLGAWNRGWSRAGSPVRPEGPPARLASDRCRGLPGSGVHLARRPLGLRTSPGRDSGTFSGERDRVDPHRIDDLPPFQPALDRGRADQPDLPGLAIGPLDTALPVTNASPACSLGGRPIPQAGRSRQREAAFPGIRPGPRLLAERAAGSLRPRLGCDHLVGQPAPGHLQQYQFPAAVPRDHPASKPRLGQPLGKGGRLLCPRDHSAVPLLRGHVRHHQGYRTLRDPGERLCLDCLNQNAASAGLLVLGHRELFCAFRGIPSGP